MKVKIVASKPIDKGCLGIEEHIGKIFEVYKGEDGYLFVDFNDKNYPINGFILFEEEYEIIED